VNEKNIYFVTATDPIFGTYVTSIKANPEETQQTFTNLQTNKVQSMEGKEELRISTAGKNENVIVATEGMSLGIAKEYLLEIHDLFFTTQEQVAGTSLGLDIVRSLTGGQRWQKN
jgi:C4-dicarboxylate-specific signal transduction histidine kinase